MSQRCRIIVCRYDVSVRCMAVAAAIAIVLVAAVGAPGASLYWDVNGAAPGLGGTGNWNTANYWNTDPTGGGGGTVGNWVGGSDAVFDGTVGNVHVNSAITANSMAFGASGYTFTGSYGTYLTAPTIDTGAHNADMNVSFPAAQTSITKNGTGTLTLSGGIRTWVADLYVNAGKVLLNKSGGTYVQNHVYVTGPGTVQLAIDEQIAYDLKVNSGTLDLNGRTETVRDFVSMGGGSVIDSAGGGKLIITSTLGNTTVTGTNAISADVQLNSTAARTRYINIAAGGQLSISGVLSEAAGKKVSLTVGRYTGNTGTLTLTGMNTYTGVTKVDRVGTLEFDSVANVGAGPSALGAPTTVADGTIFIQGNDTVGNGSTLRYVGTNPAGHTTDRKIQLNATPANLDASGVGPVNFTNTVGGTNRPLVLTGTGVGEIGGNIALGSFSVADQALTKRGSGTWILSSTSTATFTYGKTVVEEGTLIVNGAIAPTKNQSTVTVWAGATLGGSGSVQKAVTFNSGAGLAPGASEGTLTVNSNLTMLGDLTYEFEIGPSASDSVNVNGTLAFNLGTITVELGDAGGAPAGDHMLFTANAITGYGDVTWALDYGETNWIGGQIELRGN